MDEPLSDAIICKRIRQRKIGLLLLITLLGAASFLGGLEFAAYHLRHVVVSPLILGLIGGALAVFLVGSALVIRFTRLPPGVWSSRARVTSIDEKQLYFRRWFLIFVPTTLLLLAAMSELQTIRVLDHPATLRFFFDAGIFALVGTMTLLNLTPYAIKRESRAVLNDEFTQAIRARAFTLGFWVLLACLVALYAAGLYDPKLAVEGIIPALYLAIAVPALRYCFLDWKAGRA